MNIINTLKQIGIAFVMAVLFALAMITALVVWGVVLVYSGIKWVMEYDGYSHDKGIKNIPQYYYKVPPVEPTQLDKDIEAAFSNKPFPKSYSPDENPLYQMTKDYDEWKAKHPTFDREKVFAEVDKSNVRMSAMSSADRKKLRHNLRDSKGRFVKQPLDNAPITRYGEKTHIRFGNQ